MSAQSTAPTSSTGSKTASNIRTAAWLGGPAGRGVRIIAGLALIILGFSIGGTAGWIVGIVGLVPLALGLTNRCLISRLIGAPFKGQEAIDLVKS